MSDSEVCCRLAKIANSYQIDVIKRTGQAFFPEGAGEFDVQYDMSKEADGFPCKHLDESLPNGACCTNYENRPPSCVSFPTSESRISTLPNCSYTFDEDGVRTGTCNGCQT